MPALKIKTELKTKNGRLTRYALACGYVETKGSCEKIRVFLFMEHQAFHVKSHNFETGKRVFWETFDNITDARNCYDKAEV